MNNAPWSLHADFTGDRTGKDIQDDGDYVILSEDQIKAAYPKSTQTIEIESFVKASEIPFTLLVTPYHLEPAGKGKKVYALLRESMLEAGVIAVTTLEDAPSEAGANNVVDLTDCWRRVC